MQGYWGLFRDKITLDEWECSCVKAMEEQTFHKVPTPALLMDSVRVYRQLAREQREHARRQTRQLMAPEESLEKVRELIAGVFRDDRLKDPIPPYEQEAP